MATTEIANPPDKCPICGMEEDYRDTDNSRPVRVFFQCGIRIVFGSGAYPAGSWWWDGECVNAQQAALRCGATLYPSAAEQARQQLAEAARGLLDYRNNNALNFQLEKADDFLLKMSTALIALEA